MQNCPLGGSEVYFQKQLLSPVFSTHLCYFLFMLRLVLTVTLDPNAYLLLLVFSILCNTI